MSVSCEDTQGISLAWRDLSKSNINEIKSKTSNYEKTVSLSTILGLSVEEDSIVLDLYFYLLKFAEEVGFSVEKTSALFSLIKSLHEHSISDPFRTIDSSFSFFRDLLIKHSVDRPPFSVALFDLEDVNAITDYVVDTYFRHFKLYQYAFTKRQVMDVSTKTLDQLVIPSPFPPLVSGEVVIPPTEKEEEGASTDPQPEDSQSPQQDPAQTSEAKDDRPGSKEDLPEQPKLIPEAQENGEKEEQLTEEAVTTDQEDSAESTEEGTHPVENTDSLKDVKVVLHEFASESVKELVQNLQEDIEKQIKSHEEEMIEKVNKMLADGRKR